MSRINEQIDDLIITAFNTYPDVVCVVEQSNGYGVHLVSSEITNNGLAIFGLSPKQFQRNLQQTVRIIDGIERIDSADGVYADSFVVPEMVDDFNLSIRDLFQSPVVTAELQDKSLLRFIHYDLITSGLFLLYKDVLGQDPFDYHEFCRGLSMMAPAESQAVIGDMYSRLCVLTLFGFKGLRSVTRNSKKISLETVSQVQTRGQKSKDELEDASLTTNLGIPSGVRPASVLGVAYTIGQYGKSVFAGEDIRQIEPDSVLHYGTTDFANPAEAIQLAVAKNITGREGIYLTDPTSHSVGDYMLRILIPSIATLYRLDDINISQLEQIAGTYQSAITVDLNALSARHYFFNKYFDRCRRLVPDANTFSELYEGMNAILCRQLELQYMPHAVALDRIQAITVDDLVKYIKCRESTVQIEVQMVRQMIIDFELSTGSNQYMADSKADKFIGNIFGREQWGVDNLRLFNRNSDHAKVDHADLHGMTIAEVYKGGISMGGNAWVNMIQMARKKLLHANHIAMVHKNTKQGANYVLPAIGADGVQIAVMPVIRVTPPKYNDKRLNGDGLDIGIYFMYPDLINIVSNTFRESMRYPNLVGGENQVILSVQMVPYYFNGEMVSALRVQRGVQPVEGGNIKVIDTKYLA